MLSDRHMLLKKFQFHFIIKNKQQIRKISCFLLLFVFISDMTPEFSRKIKERKKVFLLSSNGGLHLYLFPFDFPFNCEVVSSGISSQISSKYSELVSSDVISRNLKRDRTRIDLLFQVTRHLLRFSEMTYELII